MRLAIFIYVLCTIGGGAFAQKHDYVWLMGQNSQLNPLFSGTVIDFKVNPFDIYREFRDMFFSQANTSMCDTAGNLLFYTNGIYVANALGEVMENGEGLNPGPFADSWQEWGYILEQGVMALPWPDNDSLFVLLHMDKAFTEDQMALRSEQFYYTIVNINLNDGIGAVVKKNQSFISDNMHQGKISSTKHANGRDWWLLIRRFGANEYHRVLVTREGLTHTGMELAGEPVPSNSLGQATFSSDGTKYADVNAAGYAGDPIHVSIFDFDRCSGALSNPVQFTYVDTASCAGIAISPNNRFLYVSSFRYVYQYDLWATDIEASRITVAEWDGFVENNFFATTFYLMQLAPDGKIYINSNNTVSYLHVINQPDSLGLACDLCQHCVELPTKNALSLPNFPNYRLGHLAGSPCDTLRQPPTAAWDYSAAGPELAFADASQHDIRSWRWDFGDGVTDTLPSPTHQYAQAGSYTVCLVVSNPRGADTLCRNVEVTLTHTGEVAVGGGTVALAPNPATAYTQLLAPGPLPAGTALRLYDGLGRLARHWPQAAPGQTLPLGGLPAGVYHYELRDPGGGLLAQGRLLVQ